MICSFLFLPWRSARLGWGIGLCSRGPCWIGKKDYNTKCQRVRWAWERRLNGWSTPIAVRTDWPWQRMLHLRETHVLATLPMDGCFHWASVFNPFWRAISIDALLLNEIWKNVKSNRTPPTVWGLSLIDVRFSRAFLPWSRAQSDDHFTLVGQLAEFAERRSSHSRVAVVF